MAEQNTQMRLLRLFGPEPKTMTATLKDAAHDGCPGLQLLTRDGEYAVCVRTHDEDAGAGEALCEEWAQKLGRQFDAALFGMGDTTLAAAAVQALQAKSKLMAAPDQTTGQVLGQALSAVKDGRAVYDFGELTYLDKKGSKKIEKPARWLRNYPDDPVQAALSRLCGARTASDADYGVCYLPAAAGKAGCVLLSDGYTVWQRALPAGENPDALAGGWMLDMVRRLAQGKDMEPSVQSFVLGDPAPALPDAETPLAAPIATPAMATAPIAESEPAPVAAPITEGESAPVAAVPTAEVDSAPEAAPRSMNYYVAPEAQSVEETPRSEPGKPASNKGWVIAVCLVILGLLIALGGLVASLRPMDVSWAVGTNVTAVPLLAQMLAALG